MKMVLLMRGSIFGEAFNIKLCLKISYPFPSRSLLAFTPRYACKITGHTASLWHIRLSWQSPSGLHTANIYRKTLRVRVGWKKAVGCVHLHLASCISTAVGLWNQPIWIYRYWTCAYSEPMFPDSFICGEEFFLHLTDLKQYINNM